MHIRPAQWQGRCDGGIRRFSRKGRVIRVLTAWWPLRGVYTRSHSELGRENPQRRWYCVLRHGRVGRCQAFKARVIRGQHPTMILLSRGGFGRPVLFKAPAASRCRFETDAGWSSPVARQAHNLKVAGSNPAPATNKNPASLRAGGVFCCPVWCGYACAQASRMTRLALVMTSAGVSSASRGGTSVETTGWS